MSWEAWRSASDRALCVRCSAGIVRLPDDRWLRDGDVWLDDAGHRACRAGGWHNPEHPFLWEERR